MADANLGSNNLSDYSQPQATCEIRRLNHCLLITL